MTDHVRETFVEREFHSGVAHRVWKYTHAQTCRVPERVTGYLEGVSFRVDTVYH